MCALTPWRAPARHMGSAHDGQALNAARIADRLVRDAGCTWFDVEVFGFVLALTAFSTNALAQNNITVLTPTTDSCLSYTRAIEANDFMLTEGVNGWALAWFGFASRVELAKQIGGRFVSQDVYAGALGNTGEITQRPPVYPFRQHEVVGFY